MDDLMTWSFSIFDWVLLAIVVTLGAALRVVTRHYARMRLARREEGRGKPWQLRRGAPSEVSEAFQLDPKLGYLPSRAEVAHVCLGPQSVVGVTSDYEAWILAVLAKRSHLMFEFGTCTGRTAYLWARNSPRDARVHTLTLDPAEVDQYRPGIADAARDESDALAETLDKRYLYTGTDVESKVVQLYGDSKAFDESSYLGRCDLIFVDGSHARSYVESDSQKALKMIKPGGIILWHDYRSPHRSAGVFHTLNALGAHVSLLQIEGTSLVAYRARID
jgi:predicted O-methyltransferase YrrM